MKDEKSNEMDDLYEEKRLLDKEEEKLFDMKNKCFKEFEKEDYELSVRSKKLEGMIYGFPIEDNKLYELLEESRNAMKTVKEAALNRMETLEYNIQKKYNENCEKREEVSRKIKRLNKEKE